jgi:hypothetical protein
MELFMTSISLLNLSFQSGTTNRKTLARSRQKARQSPE